MERTYHTQDKSTWGPGPWQNEPDKVQFRDEATGLDCLIVRNHSGALCGYVGVPESHPLFGKHYNDLDADFDVHGGLTFSDACHEGSEETTICHIPDPGQPDHVWWFGFDCCHYLDMGPALEARLKTSGYVGLIYRDIPYVKQQIASLASQLAAATAG